MTTEAELLAELEKLRARNAQLEEKERDEPAGQARHEATASAKTSDEIRKLLTEHGIDLGKAEAFGDEVVEEFGRLQKDYPITALLVAFTLGYAVGRLQG
ncbi:hypothetical protein RA27_19975 [Ruegeria sp. ANG-R]|uniref:hypothetical protein n=1 Tax=Ruegeria sp. ANG-R TaxID=1577903 RepID=UPI00057D930F|nr:hypothetical protein [Ruegeria sp. ANG-R]KIC38697.1 hypothetical protein RA27_19975 [Ruegeria sp. ANG-R]